MGISAEIMINLVSALRAEQHSQKCANCGMALARFYNITADIIIVIVVILIENNNSNNIPNRTSEKI